MKIKITHITALLTILSAASSHGAVTITSANIQGYNDAAGSALSSAGILGLLIVDGGGDGFGALTDGMSTTNGALVGDGNDIIINRVSSNAASPPFTPAQIVGTGTSALSINLTGDLSAGDQFAIYWFPTLTTGDSTFSENDTYGIARNSSWVLPADGSSGPASEPTVIAAGNATFVVQPVPEPTSVALLGLGSLALVARRRRA